MHAIRAQSASKTIQKPNYVARCVANVDGLRGSLVIILLRESLAEDRIVFTQMS